RETRSYIPQFQAIMYVLRYSEEHNLILEDPVFPMAHEEVTLDKALNLEDFSQFSGICIEDLEELNPSILNRQIPNSHKHFALKIPKSSAQYLADNQEWIMDSLYLKAEVLLADNLEAEEDVQYPAGKIIYRVRPGDALGNIAK